MGTTRYGFLVSSMVDIPQLRFVDNQHDKGGSETPVTIVKKGYLIETLNSTVFNLFTLFLILFHHNLTKLGNLLYDTGYLNLFSLSFVYENTTK